MIWPFRNHKLREETADDDEKCAEIIELKKKTHGVVDEATENIEKLNRVLEENGITIAIYQAMGGKNGH